MPPLPVIADVYRLVFEWSGLTPLPRNIVHVRCTASSDVNDIVGAFDDALATLVHNPWSAMSSAYNCAAIGITPLDGVTAQVDVGLTNHPTGGTGGDIIMEAAMVVAFKTAQRGPRGRGRNYVGPIGEGAQHEGQIENSKSTEALSGWGELHAAMRAGAIPLEPVVASYTHHDSHSIVSVRIDQIIGVQRRRLDALR